MSFDLAALVRRAFVVVLLVYVGVGSGCWGPFVLVVPLVLVVLYALSWSRESLDLLALV